LLPSPVSFMWQLVWNRVYCIESTHGEWTASSPHLIKSTVLRLDNKFVATNSPRCNRLIQKVKDTLSIKTNPNAKTLLSRSNLSRSVSCGDNNTTGWEKGLTRGGADSIAVPWIQTGSLDFACAEVPSCLAVPCVGAQRDWPVKKGVSIIIHHLGCV
jgi:hypothetical protein